MIEERWVWNDALSKPQKVDTYCTYKECVDHHKQGVGKVTYKRKYCVECAKKRGGLISWIMNGCYVDCPNYKEYK